MKMVFYSHANKTHFHKKGFELKPRFESEFLELGNGLLGPFLQTHIYCLIYLPFPEYLA